MFGDIGPKIRSVINFNIQTILGFLGVQYGGTGQTSLTTHGVVIGEGTAGVNVSATGTTGYPFVGQGSSSDPLFATTGLVFTSWNSPITTDVDGATITFNLATSNWHQVQLGGNRTLALSNPTTGQQFTLIIQQPSSGGANTVTWFSGILWPAGVVPTLTTTNSKRDVFTFSTIGSGVYLGFIAGQNM